MAHGSHELVGSWYHLDHQHCWLVRHSRAHWSASGMAGVCWLWRSGWGLHHHQQLAMTWLQVYNACCAHMQNGTWKPNEKFEEGVADLKRNEPNRQML